MPMTQIELAKLIAYTAHGARGQTRADGRTPYYAHCTRVAELVEGLAHAATLDGLVFSHSHCVAAALLHDVVEDTKLSFIDLSILGVSEEVMELVELMTK